MSIISIAPINNGELLIPGGSNIVFTIPAGVFLIHLQASAGGGGGAAGVYHSTSGYGGLAGDSIFQASIIIDPNNFLNGLADSNSLFNTTVIQKIQIITGAGGAGENSGGTLAAATAGGNTIITDVTFSASPYVLATLNGGAGANNGTATGISPVYSAANSLSTVFIPGANGATSYTGIGGVCGATIASRAGFNGGGGAGSPGGSGASATAVNNVGGAGGAGFVRLRW